jgi:hypothetical protein
MFVRETYLYAGDLFKPLDLSWGELVELAEKPEAVLEWFGRGRAIEQIGEISQKNTMKNELEVGI